MLVRLLLGLPLLVLTRCGSDNGDGDTVSVQIPVEARVGSAAFACGQTYSNLGTSQATYAPKDLRLYLHHIRLVAADGQEEPLQLNNDGVWQNDGVALLDFEDRTGLCINGGTAETHKELAGRVKKGQYVALRFAVGVPFDKNHQDATAAKPPLDRTSMFWNWNGGYKFIRIDGQVNGSVSHSLHLGSTGCLPAASNLVSSCGQPNRPEISLDTFDAATQKLVIDLESLFAGSDLAVNATGSASGCQSDTDDPDCEPIFPRLGLPFGSTAAGTQLLFRGENRP